MPSVTVIDVSVTGQVRRPRLSWGGTETRTTWMGGHSDAPAAPVVERARGRRARGAGGRDGGGSGGRTVSSRARRRARGPSGLTEIPRADGFIAYLTLLNERDGGINGVTLVWEECETVYDVERGVECYERLKGKGPTGAAAFLPVGTPITYALTERATHDQIPLLTTGMGRSDAADGRVFPYVFPAPSTWWSQNTAKLRFIGQRVGGLDQLKGLKIAHVYYDNDYGRETLPILDTPGRPVRLYGAAPGRAHRRGWTRRRPGCGSRSPSPTGSSCAAKAS